MKIALSTSRTVGLAERIMYDTCLVFFVVVHLFFHFRFVKALTEHLKRLYPYPSGNSSKNDLVHMFFPSRSHSSELLPFFLTLFVMFSYVYFSSKKIDLVYSKLGVAFCSVTTVLCSMMLSIALTGVTLNMSSKMCVVPYIVTFISLENLMVITRSVVGTKTHLDVKIRVAQGLSREGWNIMTNLFTELTILTIGFFIGILDPSIQEFCQLLVMGLLSDFFLQMFFFTPVLALDMSRMSLSDAARKPTYKRKNIFQHPISGPGVKRISLDKQTSVLAPQCSRLVKEDESKRVKFMNFWTKRRIIQRLFSLCMVVWISLFVYQSSLLETIFKTRFDPSLPLESAQSNISNQPSNLGNKKVIAKKLNISALIADIDPTQPPAPFKKLLHNDGNQWTRLPHTHWPLLFGLYNVSLYKSYITVLPPIELSMLISPETAKELRHPQEELKIQEEAAIHSVEGLKTVLELSDEESEEDVIDQDEAMELNPFVPTSPGELFLAIVFAIPSVFFLLYTILIIYRCVCSRNYAEWRSSWNYTKDSKPLGDVYTQVNY